MIETHPRVSWAICLQNTQPEWQHLVQTYKDAQESREQMLCLFEQHTESQAVPEDHDRCVQSADNLDGLMCAHVAYLFQRQEAGPLPPALDRGTRTWEGAAIVPLRSWAG